MGGAVSNYGFAAASDDNGHEESGIFGEWRANNTESQIDFGYRGVHLSTVFSKNILEAFYGKPEKSYKSYWLGCSSGGKQGLKEIQMYPEDYDGVLAGSPAWWWSHLTGYTVLGSLLNPTGLGYVNYSDFSQLHASIISQCDAIDGLTDGIIANPALCRIDWSKTGLTLAQQKQAQQFYTNWTEPSGKLIFPAFSLGAEETGLAGIIGG
jgi:feruloyl esterase